MAEAGEKNEMLERAAKAMLDRIALGWPAMDAEDPVNDDHGSEPFVSDPDGAGGYVVIDGRIKPLDVVRAVLMAMRLDHRSDTELGMAGHAAIFQEPPDFHGAAVFIDGWNAVIDEALK